MTYLKKNIGFIITMIFFAAMIFIPEFKATILQGLMKVGLFKPGIDKPGIESQGTFARAPYVELISSKGERLNLADAKGKVIFLNFWATWCPPCIAEMPSIQALKDKLNHSDSVIFAMVDADNKLPSSVAFMTKNKYTMPVYVQATAIPESLFGGSLPTTVIINKKGEIVLKHEGLGNYDSPEMISLINELSK